MQKANKQTFLRILENEKYFDNLRDFERELYPLLLDRDTAVWKKLANDKTLSKQARMRSAYVYSYLANKFIKLRFQTNKLTNLISFYHNNKVEDGLAEYYGLKNGLDNRKSHQFKNTGSF